MTSSLLRPLPPAAPRSGNAFGRALGRSVLRVGGWRVVGEWPDIAKLVIIAAPHSSAWDAIWGIAAKLALGMGIVFIGKKEAFWGPVGWALRMFGGVPVDRSAPGGIVDQVAKQLRDAERMWFVLAPEGTRRKVENWKTGFWKIARRAQVPVFCIGFNYPDRTIRLGELVTLSDDMEADMRRIRLLFAGYRGKHRNA
ncbi:MAG: 1-acyl-sn-glycerol-3-phosphate acyltransferase [Arenimonas sp.]|nr:1-acyl-sn-glycerol-3-phosphate acyltransferase [Arenimonas sp.]